ncbi:MAG: hypothetical protein KKG69_17925 [Alphaproteobacteria bacterium]|uniref:Uncharacterized protein n=1 Tax=viral metagenome TaxID=1070528 RepID=A0A6H1ZCD1_9ZZZZ|nr:hypothetical protein [Alphaproteobacteria bacterium]
MSDQSITSLIEKLEARMLSGEPFTYGGLSKARSEVGDGGGKSGDDDRMIDKTIQRLRRKGRISFTREGRDVVWRAHSEARV